LIGGCALLCLAARGRVLEMAWISGSDLAFFHQSIWSAAHGLGLAQTVLPFENTTLANSQHFSLVRFLVAPVYGLFPGVGTLVTIQAAVVGLSAALVWALARQEGGKPWQAAALFLLHPMTVVLACTDFRPIVFALPGVLVAALGLARQRSWVVVLGGLLALAAREEGSLLIAALAPYAWSKGRVRSLVVVLAVAAAGPVVVAAVLGNPSHFAALPRLRTLGLPARDELVFMALCLAPVVLLWRGWTLLIAALLAWLPLLFLPYNEAAAPGALGAHYLAFVYPLLMAGLVVGMADVPARKRGLAIGLTALVSLPYWYQAAAWVGASLGAVSQDAVELRELMEPAVGSDGPVLADKRVAPLLAERERLYVTGELGGQLDHRVDWAVTPRGDPWEIHLYESGLEPCGETRDWQLWCGSGEEGAGLPRAPPG